MTAPPVRSQRAEAPRPPAKRGEADSPFLLFDVLAAEAAQQLPEAELPAELRQRREEVRQELAALDWTESGADDTCRRLDSELVGGLYAWLHAQARAGRPRSALCFSGGGIRSATFGLGIVQGLARHGLLTGFDFLSTVSGGGYLGSWLSAWIDRKLPPDREPTPADAAAAVAAVQKELAGPPAPASALCPEPEPLRHLRAFSRYMSPRLGFLSADTWTLVGLYLRNLSLNWLVLLPLLTLALMPPRARIWLSHTRPATVFWQWAPFWFATLCGVVAISYLIVNRPSLAAKGKVCWWPERLRSQGWFLTLSLAPLSLMVLSLTVFWAWLQAPGDGTGERYFYLGSRQVPTWAALFSFGALLFFAAYLVSRVWVHDWTPGEPLAVLLSGGIGGLFTVPVASGFPVYDGDHLTALYAAFAGPLVLWLFLMAATVFVGLGARLLDDADLEWLARAGSWMLIAIVVGAAVNAIVIFGPPLLLRLPQLFATLGGLSGLATALLGGSAKTPGKQEEEKTAKPGLGALASRAGLALAAPLFVVLLLAALSLATTNLVRLLGGAFRYEWHCSQALLGRLDPIQALMHTPWQPLLATALAFGLVGYVMGRRIDINRFSLHGAYRDRLIRAYLGASRLPGTRRPNPFTGFDHADNIEMRRLRGNRPLHVVNIALNLVRGQNLAWQDRKAESFTVSPLHCGSWQLGYRDSADYGRHPGRGRAISLGTALAISGAAASPNMGYHSSPVITFLLALFNVRLGWWLGNPGRFGQKTYGLTGPQFAPWPLIAETFGLTSDRHPWVYLSDGGHFDNLGLYEMVIRRCRLVLAVDAEQDEKYRFAGLGAVIAKLRTDFGVPITFDVPPPMRPYDASQPSDPAAPRAPYYALGRIRYSCVDGTPRDDDGWLLYVKASLNGSEPVDVLNYAKTNPAFPHESTGDQLYSEAQFESYRALGSHVLDWILEERNVPAGTDLAGLFAILARPRRRSAAAAVSKRLRQAVLGRLRREAEAGGE